MSSSFTIATTPRITGARARRGRWGRTADPFIRRLVNTTAEEHAVSDRQSGRQVVRFGLMKYTLVVSALLLAAAGLSANDKPRITGEYVEARTAEVFAGGCIMNSEAETMGRQAVMAWRITSGTFDGVPLEGLTVAAAVAGDRNLGMREMGGEEPTAVNAIITVDPRATAAPRGALGRMG